MSTLNPCDKDKIFALNCDAGRCDSRDSVFVKTQNNSFMNVVDSKNGDDSISKSSLCDDSCVVTAAGNAGEKILMTSTLAISTSGESLFDQNPSYISGNDFSKEPLDEESEVKFGYRRRPGERIEMNDSSDSQRNSGVVQLECNTLGPFTEIGDGISCSSLQDQKIISYSCDEETINHKSINKILQSHELSSNNTFVKGQVLEVNDLTLKMTDEGSGKVVNKCLPVVGGDSMEKVTMRRKVGPTSAVTVGPDAELSQVLQRRSNYLTDWEVQLTSRQVFTEADRRVIEYEKKLEEEKARRLCQLNEALPIIVNEELSKIMNERKEVVDSMTSLEKEGEVDVNEMVKSTSIRPVLKLENEVTGVDLVTGNDTDFNSDSNTEVVTLNREASIEVECHENDENFGSRRTVLGVGESCHRLCSGDMSKLSTEGVKVTASETLTRKSSWTPASHSLFNPCEFSPRQKTQPVTSKEVEKALQFSSLSPELIPTYSAMVEGNYTEDRPKARGILKTHEHEKTPLRGILKHRSDQREAPVKGILKTELPAAEPNSKSIHGILKHDSSSSVTDRRHQSILKHEKESANQLPLRGALKRDSESLERGNDMEPEVAPSWHSKEQLLSNNDGQVEAETGSTAVVNEYCADIDLEESAEKKGLSDGNYQREASDGSDKREESDNDNKDSGSIAVQMRDSESAEDKGDSLSAENKGDSELLSVPKEDSESAENKGDGGLLSVQKGDSVSAENDQVPRPAEDEIDRELPPVQNGDSISSENRGDSRLPENREDSKLPSVQQRDSRSSADKDGSELTLVPKGNSGSAGDKGESSAEGSRSGSNSDQEDSLFASDQEDCGSTADQGDSVPDPHEDNGAASDPTDSVVEGLNADMNSKYLRSTSHVRHLTEPTTSDAIQEAAAILELPDIKAENITPKSSVSERLAALQKSGDNWKLRKEPVRDIVPGQRQLPGVAGNNVGVSEATEVVRRTKLKTQPTARPESIADRLSLLRGAQEGWKAKVTEKDTKMFTVEGKLDRLGIVMERPLQSKADTPGKEIRPRVVKIEVTPPVDNLQKTEEPEEKAPVIVEVPTVDSKLMAEFFSPRASITTSATKVEVTFDDFDHIFMNSNDVLKQVQKPTPKRTKAGSRNPLKTMSQHITLQNEYREESTGIAERELKRIKKERVIGTPLLAQEALAGLASKENFSKVSLRKKAESFHGTGLGDRHLPHKEIMLLQVKGRKWCQTRLIEPLSRSINSGDCYLLVTPDIVFHYVGKFSNVIERNKSFDLASQICQKHDLCVRPACELVLLDEEKLSRSKDLLRFWALLGEKESSNVQVKGPRSSDEDDWYEASINLTNRVYRFLEDKLVFVPDYSGKLLKHEMLRSTEVYVFDFGSEMYVWIGKKAVFDQRRVAVKLAFELWQKGYDFKDDAINPLSPLIKESDGVIPVSGKERPKWALFGKVNQNMETVVFKEKFIDWPDATRLIKAKGRVSEGEGKADLISDLKPCDAKKMFETRQGPSIMVLEGSHVGRGKTWEEVQDGIKWEYEIKTHDTKVWHVTEFSAEELDLSSYGQFHSEDTYVVRWHYSIHQIARTLKGKESHKTQTGRTRCVYFFWQGEHSSINEKGASALMTVELDTERGPQVQLSQGKEPPCFLNLFNGLMVVHLDKRSSESQDSTPAWKLFVIRNEMPNEVCLLEVSVAAKNLRSRTSFVLLNVKTGSAFVWHGAKSLRCVQKATMQIAENLQKRCPKEFGMANGAVINIEEFHEGSETKEFWSALGGRCSRSSYGSLLDDCRSCDNTPRLFFMTSVSGTFEATEIANPVANDGTLASAYPFLQADLYIEDQPALFLLDNHHEVYLWQGWWPLQTADGENVHTGSAETRFNVNRKCAMETALAYSKEICASKQPPVYLVYAGSEPIEFTSLFPRWQPDERAIMSPSKGSRTNSSLELVSDVLAKLTRKDYTFEELKQRPLPEGVDPLKLEMYLIDNEFEMVVGMKRKEFSELQAWRQTEVKQKVGLF